MERERGASKSQRVGFAAIVHYLVNFVDCEVPMDVFYGFAGVLHGEKSFLIDIGRFDGVDLVFEHRYLGRGLFEGVFLHFLAFECCPGSYLQVTLKASAVDSDWETTLSKPIRSGT